MAETGAQIARRALEKQRRRCYNSGGGSSRRIPGSLSLRAAKECVVKMRRILIVVLALILALGLHASLVTPASSDSINVQMTSFTGTAE